jgi:phosphatidylinositol alpha-1,6-mannosyltransferase
MKIAYVLPYLQRPAGWRSHTCALINAIRKDVEPILFVGAADYEIARSLFPNDQILPIPTTQEASFSSLQGTLKLASCFAAIQTGSFPEVDLVHSLEAYPTGMVGHWLARRLGCPNVITSHGTYGVIWHEKRIDRPVYARVLSSAAVVCPVSHGTARIMQNFFGEPLARTRLHPVINGNDFYKTISPEIAHQRRPAQSPDLLSVGQIKPRKGLHTSLAAFSKAKEQFPQARYRIAGLFAEDDYYHKLKKYIVEHALEGVEFLGQVSQAELHCLYQEASLFILTPEMDGLRFEGFGLVYLEAGAYGLPVVATDSGGVSDAVKDGETGFLVPEGDVEAVSEAIVRLLRDPDLAARMGKANRLWAETLTWERCAQEYIQVYEDATGK